MHTRKDTAGSSEPTTFKRIDAPLGYTPCRKELTGVIYAHHAMFLDVLHTGWVLKGRLPMHIVVPEIATHRR